MPARCFHTNPQVVDYDYGVPRIYTPRRGTGHLPTVPAWPTLSPFGNPAIPPHSMTMTTSTPFGQANLTLFGPSREDGAPLWMSGTFPPIPYGIAVPIQLNPLLIVNPNDPNCPPLQWDVSRRPDTAVQFTGRELYLKPDLDQEAIAQDVHRIVIHSGASSLASWMQHWGPIEVTSAGKIKAYDVLEAVYRYLQIPLTHKEYKKAIRLDPENARRFHEAAYWRIATSSQIASVEQAQGLKRVDVLGDYKYFRGFRPVWHEGLWAVIMELGARGVLSYPLGY
ncbi:hypothetical protein BDN71DRAFT_697399 [Pleurotus eryngii]|uniref:DUF6699 domain-containing protein n=1 Tax=Pleurotus eryngii TaxID=5323 RepID=A0A9P6ABS5_PLEER|nr:hypothetical protein BDN71DRAFT_697399 [Pleurotus eryngii]